MDTENSPVEGISYAIKRATLLQDKLRKAISKTSPVHCSADRSLASLNREREALLLVRDHLEVLENKLRDIRCLESRELADKDGCMYDLDTYRRNLLEAGKGVLNSQLATASRELITEVLAFVDGGPAASVAASPLTENNSAMRSPVSLSELSSSPFLHASFLNNPPSFTPTTEQRTPYIPAAHTTYGKINVRNYAGARTTSIEESGMHVVSDSMSDLYADIRTSCAASRACSHAASIKNDDTRSIRSGRHSCANCGHELPAPDEGFRPLKWLSRAALLGAALVWAAQSDWGHRIVTQRLRRAPMATMGHEFSTGSTVVANGVEGIATKSTLAVWPPPNVDAGRG